MSEPVAQASPTRDPQQQPPTSGSGPSIGSSGGSVQRMLRSAGGYAQGAAMLTPRAPTQMKSAGARPVQMHAPVQRDGEVCLPDEGPMTYASEGGSSGGGGPSGGASTPSGGGGGGASPNVYNEQDTVGHTTSGGSNPHNGAAISASTANGGTIEAGREFELGQINVPPVALPVPGLFLTCTGGVKAAASVAIQGIVSGEAAREYQVSVTGTIQAGIEAGAPPLASMYLRAGPVLRASGRAKFDSQGLKSVDVDLSLDSTISVGVQGGSGAFDYSIQLARANIARIIGVSHERGRPIRWATVQPGSTLVAAAREAKTAYDRVLGWARAGRDAIQNPGQVVSRAWNWLTG